MPCYHVIFKEPTSRGPHALSFTAADAGQALAIAQRQSGQAEIWCEEEFLCSIEQSGTEHGFWMISPDRKYAPEDPEGIPGEVQAASAA